MKNGVRQIVEVEHEEALYSGFSRLDRLTLSHSRFDGGMQCGVRRELLRRRQAVGVLIVDPANELLLMIEQFRVGAIGEDSAWLLEIVAGLVEEGEALEAVVRREAEEEAGVLLQDVRYICDYLTSPGFTDEKLSLFVATADLSAAGGVHGLADEHEDIRVHVLPLTEAEALLLGGRVCNATALIALQWLLLNRVRLLDGKLSESRS